ncbi:MAG: AEC family transporter [Sporolactobacillus sp.]
MTGYLHLLFSITVPIVILCGCGFLLQNYRKTVDTKLLADISLYILAPALILSALSESHLKGQNVWHIFIFTVVMTVILWLTAILTAKLLHLPEKQTRALTLTTLFSNSNNYGLPVLLLAYGRAGFSLGAVYVIGQIILVNILGMYVASRDQMNGKQAVIHIFKSPLIYACIIGFCISLFHWTLPGGLSSAINMMGAAYPTLVLLILGTKLAATRLSGLHRKDVWIGIGLRLLIIPLLAKGILILLGIHGMLASVLFVEASMPAAINAVTLAEKFDGDTEMISLVVTVTTLLSFLYLPALIFIS